jgi:hypothetical protein
MRSCSSFLLLITPGLPSGMVNRILDSEQENHYEHDCGANTRESEHNKVSIALILPVERRELRHNLFAHTALVLS